MNAIHSNLGTPSSLNTTFTQTTPYKATVSGFALLAALECVVFGTLYLYNLSVAARHPEVGAPRSLWRFLVLVVVLALRLCLVSFYISFDPYDQYPDFVASVYRVVFVTVTVWFTMFLCMPALLMPLCWYYYGLGDKRLGEAATSGTLGLSVRRIVGLKDTDAHHERKYHVIVIVPIYNEEPEILWKGISALLNSTFSKRRLEIHLSFDNPEISDLFKDLLRRFRNAHDATHIRGEMFGYRHVTETTIQFYHHGAMIFVHRWLHGGKRPTQAKTFNFIRTHMNAHADDTVILLIDSDNEIHRNAINNFVVSLNRNPRVQALAGYMTCVSSSYGAWNPMRVLQDAEYTSCEINRALEVIMGSVICLPGGLTLVKYLTLLAVAPVYFGDLPTEALIDYHRNHLGEDRYLTHLLHQRLPSGSLGFCPSARCKTEPPTNLSQFLKQRRRWLLGAVSNDAYMLMDVSLWKKFPLLMTYKCFQTAWRSTTVCQYLLLFGAVLGFIRITPEQFGLNIPTVTVPFAIAWFGISIIAIRLRRYKVPFLWPLLMFIWPVGQCMVDVYTLFTWSKRTWGGPRTVGSDEANGADEASGLTGGGGGCDEASISEGRNAAEVIRTILWKDHDSEDDDKAVASSPVIRVQVERDDSNCESSNLKDEDPFNPPPMLAPAYLHRYASTSGSSDTLSVTMHDDDDDSSTMAATPTSTHLGPAPYHLPRPVRAIMARVVSPGGRDFPNSRLYYGDEVSSNEDLLHPPQSSRWGSVASSRGAGMSVDLHQLALRAGLEQEASAFQPFGAFIDHGANILIADGNYPLETRSYKGVTYVHLNLRPGQLPVTDVLEEILTAVPVERTYMVSPPVGLDSTLIFKEFNQLLKGKEFLRDGKGRGYHFGDRNRRAEDFRQHPLDNRCQACLKDGTLI
ncbi:chitin synthase-domain-containing protein [Jimgerdemannia flammicorona]|uniref:chitin synthase n=1 Tax=Jimgerdemannia flammicorona TaxID=994334 RepID=A0A433QUC1_9FUNG|nr:chitin synthase-domain-containing protein [Jimgerdemannia flammicorona]